MPGTPPPLQMSQRKLWSGLPGSSPAVLGWAESCLSWPCCQLWSQPSWRARPTQPVCQEGISAVEMVHLILWHWMVHAGGRRNRGEPHHLTSGHQATRGAERERDREQESLCEGRGASSKARATQLCINSPRCRGAAQLEYTWSRVQGYVCLWTSYDKSTCSFKDIASNVPAFRLCLW